MMRTALFVLLLVAGCGSTSALSDASDLSTRSPAADLATSIDLADPYAASPDGGACRTTLSDWCANDQIEGASCISTLAQAEQASSWTWICAPTQFGTLKRAACPGFVEFTDVGADTAVTYVYDTTSGALVAAYITNANFKTNDCEGGPARFATPAGCGAQTIVCSGP